MQLLTSLTLTCLKNVISRRIRSGKTSQHLYLAINLYQAISFWFSLPKTQSYIRLNSKIARLNNLSFIVDPKHDPFAAKIDYKDSRRMVGANYS